VNSNLADYFQLTQEERSELLPSGRQARFDNRVYWSTTYLRKSQLIESRGRGRFVITQRGLDVLGNPPERISISYLQQFPEFTQFRETSNVDDPSGAIQIVEDSERTLDEIMREAFASINDQLAEEILARTLESPPKFFEQLVIDLLLAMGYGGTYAEAGRAIGASGDEGIDGVINEDRLGLDVLYVQAKRYDPGNSVGRPAIQAFVGALEAKHAQKGIFITTSNFTSDARVYVEQIQKRVILINGRQLAQFMIEHNVGVTPSELFTLRRINDDYFA
jgi:restriction system protein